MFHRWDAVQRGRMVEDRNEAGTLAATVAAPMHRIEIIGGRRRAHAGEFRAGKAPDVRPGKLDLLRARLLGAP